jgi:hypothetical protein
MGPSINLVNVTNPLVQCNGYFAGSMVHVNDSRYDDRNGQSCTD